MKTQCTCGPPGSIVLGMLDDRALCLCLFIVWRRPRHTVGLSRVGLDSLSGLSSLCSNFFFYKTASLPLMNSSWNSTINLLWTHTHTRKQILEGAWVDTFSPILQSMVKRFYPSSPLGSDCTNVSSPLGGDVFLFVWLMERPGWSAQETVTFAQEQKVYFLILCNKDQISSLQDKRGEGSFCLSVCLCVNLSVFSLCLFIHFPSMLMFWNTLLLGTQGDSPV